MSRLLYRLGSTVARLRWAVIGAWLLLLGVLGGTALAFSGTLSSSFSIPGTPAQAAMDQLSARIPGAGGAGGRIVFQAPAGHTLAEPVYQQAVSQVVSGTKQLPGVLAAVEPARAGLVSADGRVGVAFVQFAGQLTAVPETTQTAIADLADAHEIDGLRIELGGAAVKQAPAIGSTEGLGVIVALVVLIVTFGSVVAAGMPLLTALVGVAVGMAGILTLSGSIEMSSTAPILALMLGLAVGIDYALFIVSRHRSQVRAGMPVAESIARATGTAGSAVVFAGLTVLIALAALAVVGIPFLTVMGLAAAATVGVSVLIAITLVPALLSLAGDRVLRKKDRAAAAALRADPDTDLHPRALSGGKVNRWAAAVTKRPALAAILAVIGLGVMALPALGLQLGLPDDGRAATDTTKRQAYDLVSQNFGPGVNGPLIITVEGTPTAVQQAAAVATRDFAAQADVLAVRPGAVSADGALVVLQLVPKSGPSDQRTVDLVHALRDAAPAIGSQTGTTLAVTGQTAAGIDVSEKLADALPIYLLIVVGLALVLLLMVFRSAVVPIKAAIGFLLSVAASFGAVVAVFQWGWLGGLFGVESPGAIIPFLPILLIGVLFGLAMDYEMFLVTGMREAYVHGSEAKAAVQVGFSAASRVVTAAAIIMTSVFAGFILAPDTIIASIGFALGLGVLVDAFVVRMTLVPAVMTLLGQRAWYLPRWLGRVLPNVDIEGEKLLAELDRTAMTREIPTGVTR